MGEITGVGVEQALLMLFGMRQGKKILSGEVVPSEITKIAPSKVQDFLSNVEFTLSYVRVHRFEEDLAAVMSIEGEAGHYARVGYLRLLTESLDQVERLILRLVYGQLQTALIDLLSEDEQAELASDEGDEDEEKDFTLVSPKEQVQKMYDAVLGSLLTTYVGLITAEANYTEQLEAARLNKNR